jgi:DNA-binding PadR family transcriptional regulator
MGDVSQFIDDKREVPVSVRHAMLALLSEGPKYGLQLREEFEAGTGEVWPLNVGQVYTTLQRLERDGLVCSQDVVQTTRPNKRVYELTDAGREAVLTWMDRPSDGPRVRDDFFMKLALSENAGAADRLGLINRQRRHYLSQMRALTELVADSDRPIPELLIEGAMLHLQADLDWLQRCQEELL